MFARRCMLEGLGRRHGIGLHSKQVRASVSVFAFPLARSPFGRIGNCCVLIGAHAEPENSPHTSKKQFLHVTFYNNDIITMRLRDAFLFLPFFACIHFDPLWWICLVWGPELTAVRARPINPFPSPSMNISHLHLRWCAFCRAAWSSRFWVSLLVFTFEAFSCSTGHMRMHTVYSFYYYIPTE